MTRSIGAALAVAFTALAGCGGDDGGNVRLPPPAKAVSAAVCSPITYGGEGRPHYLIAMTAAFQGPYTDHGIQEAQAIKMVLADREWRAGPYRVGLQVCEEVQRSGAPDEAKCARNARAFAGNASVVAVIGPLISACAAQMLSIANSAPGGPLPMVSPSNTYLGLTRAGPGTGKGEPDRYYPTGTRHYMRLAPTDDTQGAASAMYAKRTGVKRVYILDDGEAYGQAVAAAFGATAKRLGLQVLGTAHWRAKASHYRALARRVRAAGADGVFTGGYVTNNAPRLIRDLRAELGDDVTLLGPDAFEPRTVVEGAGATAEGLVISIAVPPVRTLPPNGRRFAAEFEQRFGAKPCCFSVHTAQATYVMLDAIAAEGGNRRALLDRLFSTQVRNGLIGDFEIDDNGDTTLNTIAIYRMVEGRLKFETTIAPPLALLGRE